MFSSLILIRLINNSDDDAPLRLYKRFAVETRSLFLKWLIC